MDLQGLFRSGFFAFITGAGVRSGFANAREHAPVFYTMKVALPREEMHAVDRYLLIAEALGCAGGDVRFPIGMDPNAEKWAEGLFPGDHTEIAVGLFPSARWTTKRWPRENFAALGDALSSGGKTVVIVGGPAGEGADTAGLMKERRIAALGIADPLRLAALMRRLDAVVTNDSGPMHMAAAVGIPVVALFGPTNPLRTGPYGTRHKVITAPVDCRPCYRRVCDRNAECMRLISVETVREAVEEILGKAAK